MRYCKMATSLAVYSRSCVFFRFRLFFSAINAGDLSMSYNPIIHDYLDRAYGEVF